MSVNSFWSSKAQRNKINQALIHSQLVLFQYIHCWCSYFMGFVDNNNIIILLNAGLNWKIKSAVCLLGILLGEIVKNLSKMAVPDPMRSLKMTMLSAVS